MIIVRLIFQTVFLALGQIWANKVRTVLTTLGVIIAVAAIIAIVGAMTGLQRSVLDEFETLGARRVYIDGHLPRSWRNRISWRDVQLSMEEVEAIVDRCDAIEKISPVWSSGGAVTYRDTKIDGVGVTGIFPVWHEIENRSVTIGRPFNSIDQTERRQVCLVNDKAIEELDLPADPTGEFIILGRRRFMIVGVVETLQQSAMFGGGNTSTEVFVPFETSRHLLNPNGWINMAWGQLISPDKADEAKAQIDFVLRQMRGVKPDEEGTWHVEVLQQYIDQFNRMAAVLMAAVSGIVGIALLVGGIGIMNIMLVSVSERTREIGLRKSVGAQPVVVLLQFLVEAVVLCLMGAAIGLALGEAAVLGLRSLPGGHLSEAAAPVWAIALSIGFSVVIGVVFGMFPALKAARLDPIDALRHE